MKIVSNVFLVMRLFKTIKVMRSYGLEALLITLDLQYFVRRKIYLNLDAARPLIILKVYSGCLVTVLKTRSALKACVLYLRFSLTGR